MTLARASAVYRYSGQAVIRIRYIRPGFGGRYSYAGAVSFPDGRRWPFRNLCPAPGMLPGPTNVPPASAAAFDRVAICALSWCGWRDTRPDPATGEREEGYHDDSLSDAVIGYADFANLGEDSGSDIFKVSRKPGGRCTFKSAA